MAHTRNLLMKKTSGHIDKQIVFKNYAGKTVISKYPDMSRVKRTDDQLRVNELMEAANNAAQDIIHDEKLRIEAQARLNVTRNKLYTSLIKEYFQNHKDDKMPLDRPGHYLNTDIPKYKRYKK